MCLAVISVMCDTVVSELTAEQLLSKLSRGDRPRSAYKNLLRERHINRRCGFVCCDKPPRKQRLNELKQHSPFFCGLQCQQRSEKVVDQLGSKHIVLSVAATISVSFGNLDLTGKRDMLQDFQRLDIGSTKTTPGLDA